MDSDSENGDMKGERIIDGLIKGSKSEEKKWIQQWEGMTRMKSAVKVSDNVNRVRVVLGKSGVCCLEKEKAGGP